MYSIAYMLIFGNEFNENDAIMIVTIHIKILIEQKIVENRSWKNVI